MNETRVVHCPECEELDQAGQVDRRKFLRAVGGGVAAAVGGGMVLGSRPTWAAPDAPAAADKKPGEALIKELFATLSADQKKELVLPWDHREGGNAILTRLRMYNGPIGDKHISEHYTKPQQELIGRILRSICSDEEGYQRITRNGTFDSSGSLEKCGATIFGNPEEGRFSWVFTGHHLTVRCDGNSEEGTAFGGPMYYGHSPNGYSDKNVFFYQTRSVLSVFDALDGKQREKAVVTGSPGEQAPSVRFRPATEARPGIAFADLSADQRKLVEKVMRDVLSPYRKEDADEVMEIVKATGGIEKINLAFYKDDKMKDAEPWHFWRLEGPGFVWNYRVLPHVHTFVNISSRVG